MNDERLIVYLMRGLPSCGKSTLARELAGTTGVICETDEFFYTQIGESSDNYDYSADRLDDARVWNLQRFQNALRDRISPIVVDRGNGLNAETQEYVLLAQQQGYAVELKEPNSPWWQELRVLLKYRQYVSSELFDRWAEALAQKSRETHRVPVGTIRHWMKAWRTELTVDDILKQVT